jgi:ribonuclease Z
VRAVDVEHFPVVPAFGFIFETPETRLAISGDTTYCPALIKAARGVDLLVHEVYIHDREREMLMQSRHQGSINVMSYHTRSDVVGRVARETEAGMLVLSHFVPTRFDEQELLDQVTADFAGPVVVGEDLMSIDVAGRRVLNFGSALALGHPPETPATSEPPTRTRVTLRGGTQAKLTKSRGRHMT